MSASAPLAMRVLSAALHKLPEAERPAFLRDAACYVAAKIARTEGAQAATELFFRLADGLVNEIGAEADA